MKRISPIRQALRVPFSLYREFRLPRLPKRESDMRFKETIFAIGDSHVSLFTGRNAIQPIWPKPGFEVLPDFRCFNIGPGLAFNLPKRGTTTLTRERFWAALSYVPMEALTLVSFGEIDCRAHLLRQPGRIEANVERCVENYFESLLEVVAAHFRILVYNAPPSNSIETPDPAYPSVGSCAERNGVTGLFNDTLRKRCQEVRIPFISTTPQFINRMGVTEMKWMMDSVHLSQEALPLTVQAIKGAI